jgi:hypothetical protein
MKVQTGVRIDSEVWRAYRRLCARDKIRPSLPIEEFLRLVVTNDSAISLLSVIREATKSRVDGFDAYARVLLDWYTHGKFWISSLHREDDEPIETLLLDALKMVADPDLRRKIEEALISDQRRIIEKKKTR